MTYGRLARYVLPLAVTAIVLELGQQFLSAGMARVPQATQTLAAYGLAWGLVLLLSSPLGQAKELGLVMVATPQSWRQVRLFVLILGLLSMSVAVALTFGPVSRVVIEGLHGVDAELAANVRLALLLFIPYPLLRGLALFHAGILMRVQKAALVSYAMLANLAASIVAILILLPIPAIRQQPILLPVLAIYTGIFFQLAIAVWGAYRHRDRLFRMGAKSYRDAAYVSMSDIARFFWPLALIWFIQEMSRPMINLFVARGPNPTAALAILAVLYTLGRIPYGWLNEIRSLPSAFREEPESQRYIRRFAIACAFVSLAMMLIMFWSPLRSVILERLIGVEASLAEDAHIPLLIFSFYSFIVTARGYYTGIGLRDRRTQALAPSAPARIVAILIALTVLPMLGIYGATLGIAALTIGFAAETVTVWWGVRGRYVMLARWRAVA